MNTKASMTEQSTGTPVDRKIADVAKKIAGVMRASGDNRLFNEEGGDNPRDAGWVDTGQVDAAGRRVLKNSELPQSTMYESGDNFEVVDD